MRWQIFRSLATWSQEGHLPYYPKVRSFIHYGIEKILDIPLLVSRNAPVQTHAYAMPICHYCKS